MAHALKRSNAPIFWLLFGAGGSLAALIGPMLVYLTGIGAPLGLGVPRELLSYPHVLAFAQSVSGKAFLFLVITLFVWHAAHRIYHTLHDLGVRPGVAAQRVCYGVSLVATLAAAWALLSVGF
jgi:fumarate reductase subunit D